MLYAQSDEDLESVKGKHPFIEAMQLFFMASLGLLSVLIFLSFL